MRIGILGSGSGTNAEAIIRSVEEGKCPVEVAIVISDVPDAGILERAGNHNVPARFIDAGKYKTKLEPEREEAYVKALQDAGVELVALAGFMRIIKEPLLKAYPRKIINIHPALLPSFPGLESWRQALEYGVKYTGITVHFVDEGVDTGPVILQSVVPVHDDDTPQSLHQRIHAEEYKIYPEAIRLIAENRLEIRNRRVLIKKA